MHVEVVGRGPPLVLLHGWAMHGGIFAPLADRLSRDFELHLVDLPGHGHGVASGMPLALEDVVAGLLPKVPRATWIGWSLGGLFALHAAATRAQALHGLVMLCATPRFVRGEHDGPATWPYGVSAEIFRDFADGLRADYRGTLERFIALEAFGSDDARGELRAMRNGLFARGEPAAGVLADGLGLLETTDLRRCLPGLTVPSLWLSGRRDRLVDPRAVSAAVASTPDARHLCIERAGHAPFLTHADLVAEQVAAFATGTGALPARVASA
ncbi:pimeloyl-ACP methyl ester esterase BioH [Luteimonas vadosa]|uniref:Pimeloyl-[acyl-carrier protein] methyl ester esterase n=1 Tax=Luteimonas vadosa TaxID=1165507 RepID=A0ABP9DQ50_9GAMM